LGRTRRERNECRFPDKKRLTKRQATMELQALRAKGRRNLYTYRCPSKGHYHLGRR